MMPRTFAIAAALAIAASCSHAPAKAAEGYTITSGFVSKHARSGYNERNRGFGLRLDAGEWAGWTAGYYRNSLDRDTFYVAREWQWPMRYGFSYGVIAGAATGYNVPVIPAVLPELVYRFDVLELGLIAQPLNLKDSPAFIALQVRLRF